MRDALNPLGPVLIEAAITPFRPGEPFVSLAVSIEEARQCLDAGAAIIHHHHDFRLDGNDSTYEMKTFGQNVMADHPAAILYPDFIRGEILKDRTAHFLPTAQAGTVALVPVDPAGTLFGGLDDDGKPITGSIYGMTMEDANETLELAVECGLPVTVGVYEPGNLRWAIAHARRGTLPAGSMVKLYFGGDRSILTIGKPALNFGLPPSTASLDAYLAMMEGLDIPWSVGVMGGMLLETPLARYALEKGGHLRVGIEDVGLAEGLTNRGTVEAAVALAAEVGRPVAQGNEARAVLGMRRKD